MTRIAAVHPVLPPNTYPQREITERFAAYCLGEPDGRDDLVTKHALVRRLHASASVSRRHLALPIDQYLELDGFGAANDAFIEVATELGGQAVLGALDEAGLRPDQVDYVVSTTVTGAAVPSIEARIATEIGLRPDVRRVPLFGLGCVAGASGLARLHDLLRGDPDAVGVLLSVELCSLTVQRNDPSTANLVASGLFGDGAAAVVAVGDHRPEPGPTIVDSRAHLYPDTQRAMGWDIGGLGLKIVLGAEVPDLVTEFLGEDVRQFLKSHDLDVGDVTAWVAHPGGPKVLDAMQDALGLTDGELDLTWRSLDQIGNLSSSSVLHVLRDTLDQREPAAGSPGVLLAMGPGFCSELVLLRW
jgi:alkylresorcinol/alkylpyrone synthase